MINLPEVIQAYLGGGVPCPSQVSASVFIIQDRMVELRRREHCLGPGDLDGNQSLHLGSAPHFAGWPCERVSTFLDLIANDCISACSMCTVLSTRLPRVRCCLMNVACDVVDRFLYCKQSTWLIFLMCAPQVLCLLCDGSRPL